MDNVKNIFSSAELQNVLNENNDKIILVDFWAPWCGPCRMLGPVLEDIASKNNDVMILKVNVDENQELAMEYNISSIPTVKIFKNNELVDEFVGALPYEEIVKRIDNLK